MPSGAQGLSTTEDGAYFLNGATSDAALGAVSREADWKWAITSEDEWYKAAYHKNDGVTGNYFDYPTSSNSLPSNDLIDPDPGNNATFYDNGYTIGNPYYRTEVGEHENSESPYDTFDQGGNVWEWNEAILLGSIRGLRQAASRRGGVSARTLGARIKVIISPDNKTRNRFPTCRRAFVVIEEKTRPGHNSRRRPVRTLSSSPSIIATS